MGMRLWQSCHMPVTGACLFNVFDACSSGRHGVDHEEIFLGPLSSIDGTLTKNRIVSFACGDGADAKVSLMFDNLGRAVVRLAAGDRGIRRRAGW